VSAGEMFCDPEWACWHHSTVFDIAYWVSYCLYVRSAIHFGVSVDSQINAL